MKHLKAKLMAAISMLLVATVMLTSASFAWFSISTKPEVTDIKASLSGNGNLEVALADENGNAPTNGAGTAKESGYNQKWGNMIDLQKFFNPDGNGSNLLKLQPAEIKINETTGEISGYVPSFGLDGRVDSTSPLTPYHVDNSTLSYPFADLGGVIGWGPKDIEGGKITGANRDQVYAFEVDFYVRTNYDQTPKLTLVRDNGTKRDNSTNAQKGLGSYITTTALTLVLIDNDTHQTYYLVPDASATDGKYLLTLKADLTATDNATIELTPNREKLLKLFVYEDGGQNNAITLHDAKFDMNIQFMLDGDPITSMNRIENGNGRLSGDPFSP